MKLSRNLALKINFFLDQCAPPIIRDSEWLMKIPFKLLYKDKAHVFWDFKGKASQMTAREFYDAYQEIKTVLMERETDLNEGCIDEIFRQIGGQTVLDVGCGQCFLAGKMSKKYQVTAVDIAIDPALNVRYSNINFMEANMEKLPFRNGEFDTVVCAHTLEHVQNIFPAISELRRVTKKRLIVVVPKQRPYKYTFDLHLHFFPYEHSLRTMMISNHRALSCTDVGGDLFYVEDKT
ncbi:MAG TPA: class I SAM-dependent methyltransferase [Edaphobacter sp.]|nr:class I SAM-dependent methyltransferase [Edaphobacter sp.]